MRSAHAARFILLFLQPTTDNHRPLNSQQLAALLAVALALLGLGWNLGLVAGTAIITDAVSIETRAKTQGAVDVAIAIAGATGGMGSGIMVAAMSYPALAIAGGILALAIVPVVAVTRTSKTVLE